MPNTCWTAAALAPLTRQPMHGSGIGTGWDRSSRRRIRRTDAGRVSPKDEAWTVLMVWANEDFGKKVTQYSIGLLKRYPLAFRRSCRGKNPLPPEVKAPVVFHISPSIVSNASEASCMLPKPNRPPGTLDSAIRRVATETLLVPVIPTPSPFLPSPPPLPESSRKSARSADSTRRLGSSGDLSLPTSATAAPHACRHPTKAGGSAITNGRMPTFSLLRVLAYRLGQARTTADLSIFRQCTGRIYIRRTITLGHPSTGKLVGEK